MARSTHLHGQRNTSSDLGTGDCTKMPWDSSTAPRQHPALLHKNRSCLGLYVLGASDAAEEQLRAPKGVPEHQEEPRSFPCWPCSPSAHLLQSPFLPFPLLLLRLPPAAGVAGGEKEVSKGWVTASRSLCSLEVTAWGSGSAGGMKAAGCRLEL